MKENFRSHISKILGLIFIMVLIVLLSINILKQGIFSKKTGINLAVIGDNSVSVLILRPDEEITSVVNLPEKLRIRIYNSSAKYPIGSLWKYGQLEKKPYEIIERSLGLAAGIGISRSIVIDGSPNIENILAGFNRLNLKTDLSFRDRVIVRNFLTESAQSKKILEIDIPNSVFDKVIDPDGQEFLEFNSVISLWSKNKFSLESVLSENLNVTINNVSGQTGLGSAVAKQLESAGMRVVEVKSDADDKSKNLFNGQGVGCLFTSSEKYPASENFLITQMRCKKVTSDFDPEEKGIRVWLKS